MPRPATGEVIERKGKRGTAYVLRFRANGKRQFVTIGNSADGWTRAKAEVELENVMADVRRGLWRSPRPEPAPIAPADPTFHEFASEWWAAKQGELRPSTRDSYEGELTIHLLPFFARHRLSEITIKEVDRYRREKVADGRLSATSINKTLTRLGQILEDAVDYELIPRNPAKGKRRRLKATRNPRSHVDRAAHIAALLDAAGELDAAARANGRHIPRRTIIAMLVFGGLRISELCSLRWSDVDMAGGRLRVGEAKTDAGVRTVDMLPALRDEMDSWLGRASVTRSGAYVFATSRGGRPSKDNLRSRVVGPAIVRANEALERAGEGQLPPRLTPHGLRHTYASILIALGKDPRYVMAQIGHTDPAFTLRLYTHEMQREGDEQSQLRALVEGEPLSIDGLVSGSGRLAAPEAGAGTPRDGPVGLLRPRRPGPVRRRPVPAAPPAEPPRPRGRC